MKSQLHYLSASHCAAPVTVGSELPGVRTFHHRSPIPAFPKGKKRHTTTSNTVGMHSRSFGKGYYCEGLQLPYRTKGKWRITQKDLQLFRASPYAPGWSGNIHESKLSDIHRPPPSRLPMGRLKSYKYKKSAYGGKKSPARAGKKEITP